MKTETIQEIRKKILSILRNTQVVSRTSIIQYEPTFGDFLGDIMQKCMEIEKILESEENTRE